VLLVGGVKVQRFKGSKVQRFKGSKVQRSFELLGCYAGVVLTIPGRCLAIAPRNKRGRLYDSRVRGICSWLSICSSLLSTDARSCHPDAGGICRAMPGYKRLKV
jgi:hypothetical protein